MSTPNDIQSQFLVARQAYAAGRFDDVIVGCNRLIRQTGPREEILNLMAVALLAQGRALEAARTLSKALERNSRSTGLLLNAARVDLVLADRRAAKRHALEAVRHGRNDPRVLYQAAIFCRQCGDYDQALRLARACQSLAPKLAEAHHLEGSMHLDRGDTEAARAALDAALQAQPGFARALADLASLHGDLSEQPDVRDRLEQVALNGPSAWDRSSALFALAGARHKAGQFESAAETYRRANREGASVRPFDLSGWERKQEETLAQWAELTPRGAPGQGEGARLVFLVGMPRSGTSLCEQVLAAHPDVLACGELTTMDAIEKHSPDKATLEDRRRRYLAALPPDHAGKRLVTDKLPMNFERVGLIHELFPGARFIHCRRHPLDTILSCYQQDFQGGVQWAFDLDAITRVHLAQHRLMTHWAERLPDHVLAVDYEALVEDLEKEAGRLSDFLGLERTADMLAPHQNERTVQTASRQQVRQPVYRDSVEKWRPYADLLAGSKSRLEEAGILQSEMTP